MHRLINLYRRAHRWLFDTKQPTDVWVAVQTTQGIVYAVVRAEQ